MLEEININRKNVFLRLYVRRLKIKIMATLTIRVENRSVLAELKRLLESRKGVVIVPNHKKTGIFTQTKNIVANEF